MPATETIELRPNCALTPRWARWFFAALARRRHRHAVADDSVAIDSQLPGRREHVVFSRYSAHVKLRRAVSPWHPSRLTIESHGRACEVGMFLTEEERRGLAGRLQRLVGRINELPPILAAATQPRSA